MVWWNILISSAKNILRTEFLDLIDYNVFSPVISCPFSPLPLPLLWTVKSDSSFKSSLISMSFVKTALRHSLPTYNTQTHTHTHRTNWPLLIASRVPCSHTSTTSATFLDNKDCVFFNFGLDTRNEWMNEQKTLYSQYYCTFLSLG